MSRKRPSTRELLASAGEIGPDDGVDPKRFSDRRTWDQVPRTPGRKARQLCGQVQDALHGILAGCADPVLRSLVVVAVEPAPHAGRVMVTVAVPGTADATDPAAVLGRLVSAVGYLRCEVAAVISRRKVPELAFRVV